MLADGMIVKSLIANKQSFGNSKSVRVPAAHSHTLTFRTSGSKIILPDGQVKPLVSSPGTITYIPRGTAYDENSEVGGTMYSVHFELVEECEAKPFVFLPKAPIGYENLFSDICENFRIGNSRSYKCLSFFYALVDAVRRESGASERHAVPKRIRDAIDEINRCYNDPMLSVSYLARKAGVSEVYFRREFGKCTGLSPIKYIKKVRLENARALLSTAVYSVGEVATRCGFDSISYFSEEYKRAYGVSPSRAAVKPFGYEMF